jgi:dephospho-CoA kinase
MYPQLTKEQLDSFLDEVIEKELVNQKAQIHNNYVHKPVNVDLLTVYDWFEDTKPISAGFGVFFKNQNQELNPAAVMLDNFLKLRKSYKSRLADFPETSYEYATFDRLQATEKVNANSYYGASGAPTSNFFNLYTATSVTATGQSLISTTETSFEAFLANNVLFNDINECFVFIRNIINEKHEMDDSFLPNINIHKVYRRLLSMFCSYKPQIKKIEEEYGDTIWKYLGCLTQRDLNRIYFKNNIYAFANLPRIRNKLTDVKLNVEDFKNPNKVPESIKGKLEDLWDYLKEFVFYNYFAFNRIQRLKTEKRKVVVTVDTDFRLHVAQLQTGSRISGFDPRPGPAPRLAPGARNDNPRDTGTVQPMRDTQL